MTPGFKYISGIVIITLISNFPVIKKYAKRHRAKINQHNGWVGFNYLYYSIYFSLLDYAHYIPKFSLPYSMFLWVFWCHLSYATHDLFNRILYSVRRWGVKNLNKYAYMYHFRTRPFVYQFPPLRPPETSLKEENWDLSLFNS